MVSIRKLLAPLVTVSFALADDNGPNAIIHPGHGDELNAGSTFTVKWTPDKSSSNVNLILKEGDSRNFSTVSTIAENVPNSGKYEWTVASDLPSNSAYSIYIEDPNNKDLSNYGPYFSILAVGQGITSSGVSSGASTKTSHHGAVAAAGGSGSATASAASESGASESGASASDASASGSASESGASASGASTSGTSVSGASASGASASGASGSGASASGASASGPASGASASAAESGASASSESSKASSSAGQANAAVTYAGSALLSLLAGAAALLG